MTATRDTNPRAIYVTALLPPLLPTVILPSAARMTSLVIVTIRVAHCPTHRPTHRPCRRPNPLLLLTPNEKDPEPITRRERDAENYHIPSQRSATLANLQAPELPPDIQKRKMQDRAAADRIPRVATRLPRVGRFRLFCNICLVQCNSAKTLFDHRASRAHKFKIRTRGKNFECATCVRIFESPDHFERHLNSKGLLAIVYRTAANKNYRSESLVWYILRCNNGSYNFAQIDSLSLSPTVMPY